MGTKITSTGPHDVGGDLHWLEGPVDRAEHDYALWERQVHALQLELARQGFLTVDEMRRAIEGLPAEAQKDLSYYEKWAAALAVISIERGTITQAELDKYLGHVPEQPTTAKYHAGDVVRVREEHAAVRWRRPHLRTPGYIFGVIGVIERDSQGLFGDPEALAYRHPAPKQPLYRVRFRQIDIWEGYTGAHNDTLDVEVYEPWLQPATQQEYDEQKEARAATQAAVFGKHHYDHEHGDHHHAHSHGHTDDDHDHVHEARSEVEQAAVAKEDVRHEDDRRRFPEALVRLMISKGIVTADSLRQGVEVMDSRGRSTAGAQLVVKAWLDPQFKKLLLQDASAAAAQLGINASVYPSSSPAAAPGVTASQPQSEPPAAAGNAAPELPQACQLPVKSGTILTAVENTASVHNLVVCTLCSCYPLAVLGMSPAWYKSRAYRAKAVRDPRGVLKEFGTIIPENVSVAVHDSTADNRYLVLPMRPAGTEGWTEQQLMALVTRDTMIGVAVPVLPT